ncbi:uncharacterized protein Tco025E_02430 [Trypanosoma conorhini]|uniref:Transmembrane protein n=1 Tax=Trypanosoma conorhini TaxID=83891 RepID=A0A3R7PT08_9TRYP|nr:uncharacterized protein Tco025E_02430 [Trypanosoma conorhini]RNF24671.1 hypothetical protein Tco025E_02430 [Trypanosoma conorhini]
MSEDTTLQLRLFLAVVGALALYYLLLSLAMAATRRWVDFFASLTATFTLAVPFLTWGLAFVRRRKRGVLRRAVAQSSTPHEESRPKPLTDEHSPPLEVSREGGSLTENDTSAEPNRARATLTLNPLSSVGSTSVQVLTPDQGDKNFPSLPIPSHVWLPAVRRCRSSEGGGNAAEKKSTLSARGGNDGFGGRGAVLEPPKKSFCETHVSSVSTQGLVNDDVLPGSAPRQEARSGDFSEASRMRRTPAVSLYAPAETSEKQLPGTNSGRSPPPFNAYATPELITVVPPWALWALLIVLGLLHLSLLAGSFWIAYDTKYLVAVTPVLASPLLHLQLLQLVRHVSFEEIGSPIGKGLLLLLHPVSPILLAALALVLYVACIGLWVGKSWGHEDPLGHATLSSMVLKTLCLCAPIPIFFLTAFLLAFPIIGPNKTPPRILTLTKSDRVDEEQPVGTRQSPLDPSNASPGVGGSFADMEDSLLSSIVCSRKTSLTTVRYSRSGQSVIFMSPALGDARAASAVSARIGTHPQLKSLTLLYVAFRDVNIASTGVVEGAEKKRTRPPKDPLDMAAAYFRALLEVANELELSHGPFFLTAHQDALCFVWGMLPLSEDPVLRAVDAAQHFFLSFRPPKGSEVNGALVAAVLHSPHALVSIFGTNDLTNVHFLSDEHAVGEQLLDRGFVLRGLERNKQREVRFCTSGIILDRRASHLAASHLLTRPVGVVPSIARAAMSAATFSNTLLGEFTVVYDFVSRIGDREEEWHLAAQAREQKSAGFLPAVEATHAFFQGNLKGAIDALEKPANDSDDALLRLLLSDFKRILTATGSSRRE